jgi:excisionase family DNA binding protein
MDTVMVDSTKQNNNDEELTTVEWVAQKLRVPISSIYDYARRGVLPCVRVGKLVRFRPSDIESFISSGGKKAA